MKRGDYVEYTDGNGDRNLGRVASVRGDIVFVCFHDGCTAAACDVDSLEVVEPTPETLERVHFGHHRFDDECPDYCEDICKAYCPDKGCDAA